MKNLKNLSIFVVILVLASCAKPEDEITANGTDQELATLLSEKSPTNVKDYFILPNSNDLSAIPQDPNNPLSAAKIALGKLLYHETGLAQNPRFDASKNTYSCASCHHAAAGFQAGRRQGISDGAVGFGMIGEARIKHPDCPEDSVDFQPIRSPSILNIAYQEAILWNGQFGAQGINQNTSAQWTPGTPKAVNTLGYQGTEIQAIAGFGVHRLGVNDSLFENTANKDMFEAAFGKLPPNVLWTTEKIGLAIAAYERVVLSNQAPFQKWLKGEFSAMSERQKQGAKVFFGKAGCDACHGGPNLANMEFHALGMNDFDNSQVLGQVDPGTKKGRGGFTKNPEDDYKFKVPQLYNLKDSPFYGHGGSFTSVEDVVRYKNAGVVENGEVPTGKISPLHKPLNLTEDEILALTDFIENGLYDPNLTRYVPSSLPSNLCFPFADAQAKQDMGCD